MLIFSNLTVVLDWLESVSEYPGLGRVCLGTFGLDLRNLILELGVVGGLILDGCLVDFVECSVAGFSETCCWDAGSFG